MSAMFQLMKKVSMKNDTVTRPPNRDEPSLLFSFIHPTMSSYLLPISLLHLPSSPPFNVHVKGEKMPNKTPVILGKKLNFDRPNLTKSPNRPLLVLAGKTKN